MQKDTVSSYRIMQANGVFMASRAVNERIKHVESLISMIDLHEVELVGPLSEVFSHAEGIDANSLLSSHLGLVSKALEALEDAEREVELEASDDQQYRDARDAAIAKLSTTLNDTRLLFEAAYSKELAAEYGFTEDLPRSPASLKKSAEASVSALRTRALEETSPYGFDLDLAPLADRIETEIIPLITALEDVAREAREIREAIDARNEAMANFDETFRAVAAILHSYFVLVGRPDLAAMIS